MFVTSPDAFFKPTDKPWLELTRLTVNRDGKKLGHKVQHKPNVAWAERMGVVLGDWYKEENVSTSDEDITRETWERIISEVAAGMWGGIVVWRADRLTRQTREFTRLHHVAKRQRTLIACSYDNLTTIDPSGYRRMLDQVATAEQEVSILTIRVRANSAERKVTGLYHGGGRRPWCFEAPKRDKRTDRIKNSGRIGVRHVEAEVKLAQEAAELIAWNGWSYKDVIDDWHARTSPVYGSSGRPWSTSTLKHCLTSPRMIGRQLVETADPDTGLVTTKLKKAQWKPVLERRTWDQLRSMVTTANHKDGKIKYLLTPVLECGRCGRRLTGCARKYLKGGETVPTATYRCRSGTNDKADGACGKLSVLAGPVEKLAVARIFQRLIRTQKFGSGIKQDDDLQAQIAVRHRDVERLNGELGVLDAAQKDRHLRMEVSVYLANRRSLVEEHEEAIARLKGLQDRLSVPYPSEDDWKDLPGWYETLTTGQQEKLVVAHIRKVAVLPPGRSGRYFKPERVVVTLADSHQLDGEGD